MRHSNAGQRPCTTGKPGVSSIKSQCFTRASTVARKKCIFEKPGRWINDSHMSVENFARRFRVVRLCDSWDVLIGGCSRAAQKQEVQQRLAEVKQSAAAE